MEKDLEKIIINPNNSVFDRILKVDKFASNILAKLIFFLIWVAGLLSLVVIISYYLKFSAFSDLYLGGSYIFLSILMGYLSLRSFYLSKIKRFSFMPLKEVEEKIKKDENINLFNLFSFDLAESTQGLFLSQKAITTKELFLTMLRSSQMGFVLLRLGLSREDLIKKLDGYLGEDKVKEVLRKAIKVAIFEEHNSIEVGDVFVALCGEDQFFKKLISDLRLDIKDIANVVYWHYQVIKKSESKSSFFSIYNFKLSGGIGKDWSYGYAPFLKQFSQDITEWIDRGNLDLEIIGHDKEIEEIKEALLGRSGGNAIIVGEPGIGKRTTVFGFAKKVLEGKTNSLLDFKHIVKIDSDTLLSGLDSPGQITERLSGIFNEANYAGNIIFFIEDIDNLLSSGGAGMVNASEVILPFLESPDVHLIGTCDVSSYNKYISPNTGLSEKFTRITIDEPSNEDMVRILEDTVPIIEYRTKTFVSYEAIKEAISASSKFIMDIPNPEKSINLLDSAAPHAASERGETIILPKDILEYVSRKYDIPSADVDDSEKEKLLSLEKIMHEKVIGQNEAISAIANALRRVRAGVTDSRKPIGSFLFLGPTGVGKTEASKALADAYFGSADRMIRFDMSEYQNKEDIYRLLGSEEEPGQLATAVREQPFSLLLFDEIEKANRNILDLFLQILDEGFLTDSSGRKVLFTNTIIIATSNAGANLIRESIKSGVEYEKTKKELIDFLQRENIYRPEFLNRFSGIIAFSPLSQDEIKQVAVIMIEKLKKTVLKNKGIKVEITPEAVTLLSQVGFDPQMGARPMARTIEERVENLLATKILSGELKKDDTFTISESDIG